MPLAKLEFPYEAEWEFNPIFSAMGSAKEWNIKPSALGLCDSKDDNLLMITYERSRTKMLAYEHYLLEKKLRKQAK